MSLDHRSNLFIKDRRIDGQINIVSYACIVI